MTGTTPNDMAATLDVLFRDLARDLGSSAVTNGSADLYDLSAALQFGLASTDPRTVQNAQGQLLLVASRLLLDFGDQLGRGDN